MFDISFPELVLIAIVGLLVIGPKRLPEALRTLGLWVGRMRRSFTNVKAEIEKEIGMDEIRRQLHNEAVMEEMKRIERDVRDSVNSGSTGRPAGTQAAERDRVDAVSAEGAGGTDSDPDAHVSEPDGQPPPELPQPAPASDIQEQPPRAPSPETDDTRNG